VPAQSDARRAELDVVGYGAPRDIRAMALHPLGRVFVVRKAASQTEAEEEALRQCELDPVRAGSSGPCFLYASGNRVVLAERRVQSPPAEAAKPPPLAPAGGPETPPSLPGSAAAPASTGSGSPPETSPDVARADLVRRMTEAMPFVPRPSAEAELGLYLAEPTHRDRHRSRSGPHLERRRVHLDREAEQLVLERCQVRYRAACVLFAVDDDIRAPRWPRDPRS
jgi:hypothetical protein